MPSSPAAPVVACATLRALPWDAGRHRSRIRGAAAPLLLPALRRLAENPREWHEPASMQFRATLRRLAMVEHWHRAQDPAPEAGLRLLRHACIVLAGAGLDAGRVADLFFAVTGPEGGPGTFDDETLMSCAHLSTLRVLNDAVVSELVRRHGWTASEALEWSLTQPPGHLENLRALGWAPRQVVESLCTGTVMPPESAELLVSLRRPVEDWVRD